VLPAGNQALRPNLYPVNAGEGQQVSESKDHQVSGGIGRRPGRLGSSRVLQGPSGYLNVGPTFGANFLRSKKGALFLSLFPSCPWPSPWFVGVRGIGPTKICPPVDSEQRGWLENRATTRTKEAEDRNWTESGEKVRGKAEKDRKRRKKKEKADRKVQSRVWLLDSRRFSGRLGEEEDENDGASDCGLIGRAIVVWLGEGETG
jgi:hypothetical protein